MNTVVITEAQIVDAAQAAMNAHRQRGVATYETYAVTAYDVLIGTDGDAWSVRVYYKGPLTSDGHMPMPTPVAYVLNYEDDRIVAPYARKWQSEHAIDVLMALKHVAEGTWD